MAASELPDRRNRLALQLQQARLLLNGLRLQYSLAANAGHQAEANLWIPRGQEAARAVTNLEHEIRMVEAEISTAAMNPVSPYGAPPPPYPAVRRLPRESMKPFAPPEEDLTDPFSVPNVRSFLGPDISIQLSDDAIRLIGGRAYGALRAAGVNPRTATFRQITDALLEQVNYYSGAAGGG